MGIDQESIDKFTPINTALDENPPMTNRKRPNQINKTTTSTTTSEMNEQTPNQVLRTSQKQRRIHWDSNPPKIHPIEPCGTTCLRTDNNGGMCDCGTSPTGHRQSHGTKGTERRNKQTQRSKQYRDQLTDVVTTLQIIEAINNNTEPSCPSPSDFYKRSLKITKPGICQCSMCCDDPYDDRHSPHIVRSTTDINQNTSKSDITILQRPKVMEVTSSTNPPRQPQAKTLQQRQQDYARARARIFNSAPTKAKTYKHPNHASRKLSK